MLKWLIALTLLCSPVYGATRYISPSGTDTTCATSETIGTPAKTFSFAIACMAAGDTLILRDGTYSIAAGTGLPRIVSKSGTAMAPLTMQAENERLAYIQGSNVADGEPFRMSNSNWWIIHGLRIENGDFSAQTAGAEVGSVIDAVTISNVVFRRNLLRFNNRYKNSHTFGVVGATNCLFEENESYSFHRHAIRLNTSSNNVVRRNYSHGRGYADIPGGNGPTGPTTTGDGGVIIYPGSNNIVENNIAENVGDGVSLEAAGTTNNNQFFGNIAVSCITGTTLRARGSGLNLMPQNTVIENHVNIGSSSIGAYFRGSKGTLFRNSTILNSGNSGFGADVGSSEPGDGNPTVFLTNILSAGNTGTGFTVAAPHTTWTINYPDSFGNTGAAFSPAASDARITNELTADPQLGSCKAWIPAASTNIKGAGLNSADIGANVLYQYQNGVLTSVPLWNTSTNDFVGCGAVIAGVNDVAGTSCSNVDIRLNIGTANGCDFPAGYGGTPPVGGDEWIATDDFESYSLDADLDLLNGGSDFTAAWDQASGALKIKAAPDGNKTASNLDAQSSDFDYSRAFANITAGIARLSFYIAANPTQAIKIELRETGTTRCQTFIDTDGFFKILGGADRVNIAPFQTGTAVANKNEIDIQFDDAENPNNCRARIGSGVWSEWYAVSGGSYSNINSIRIHATNNNGLGTAFYINSIAPGNTSGTIVSTISLVDAGLSGTMFVGEVKALQWSSTNLTGNIRLRISRDGGLTFQVIENAVPNTGTYNWTVSGPATTQAQIEICGASNTSICDTSATFGIGGTHLSVR